MPTLRRARVLAALAELEAAATRALAAEQRSAKLLKERMH